MKRRVSQFAFGIVVLGMLVMPGVAAAEDQPHMRAALEALEQAKQHLQQAEHDKGGHRAKALELTNQAITHVKEGMKYDRQHEDKDKDHDHDKDKH